MTFHSCVVVQGVILNVIYQQKTQLMGLGVAQ